MKANYEKAKKAWEDKYGPIKNKSKKKAKEEEPPKEKKTQKAPKKKN